MKEGNIYACSYLVCYGRSGMLGVILPCIHGQLARQFPGGLGLVASDRGWVEGVIVVIIEIFIQIHWFTCRKGFTGKRGWRWLLETTEWWKLTIILEKSTLVTGLSFMYFFCFWPVLCFYRLIRMGTRMELSQTFGVHSTWSG